MVGRDTLSPLEVVGIHLRALVGVLGSHLGIPLWMARLRLQSPPVGTVSGAKFLPEDWAPPQNLGKLGTLEAVESAISDIRASGTAWP